MIALSMASDLPSLQTPIPAPPAPEREPAPGAGGAGASAAPGMPAVPAPSNRPLLSLRLAGLVGVMWGMAVQVHPGAQGRHLVVAVVLPVTAVSWLGWLAASWRRSQRWALVSLVVMAGVAGPAAAVTGAGLALLALVGLAAGALSGARLAAVISAAAVAGLVASGLVADTSWTVISVGVAVGAAGLLAGVNRRQYQLRSDQAVALLEEQTERHAEQVRGAALAERNRLAGEIHDVLAHSLGALAVQLDALDAMLAAGPPDHGTLQQARTVVGRSRRLAVEGLDEARRAVRALRDAPVSLVTQLEALAGASHAHLQVGGDPRPLATEAASALYRAVQEALSNARKHAPGADVVVVVEFGTGAVSVTVTDDHVTVGEQPPAAAPLSSTGGGYGLIGMSERLALLGGQVEAGPTGTGWRVKAVVPA